MKDIILTLVFSSVLLIMMIYPAMKITEYLETKMEISDSLYNKLTVILTIVLSLLVGGFLHLA